MDNINSKKVKTSSIYGIQLNNNFTFDDYKKLFPNEATSNEVTPYYHDVLEYLKAKQEKKLTSKKGSKVK